MIFRKSVITPFILVLVHNLALAQNIIRNGQFEDLEFGAGCPLNGAIVAYAPWTSSIQSPDAFNECVLNEEWSVPQNWFGFQNARSGSGYVGLVTMSPFGWFGREALASPLRYPLEPGQDYYVEFWVSASDSARSICHNIGVSFTIGQGDVVSCAPFCDIYIENNPIQNPLGDKENWVKVSGIFTAQGDEDWIHISNFRADSLSSYEIVAGAQDTAPFYDNSYYYVDDVWLSHVDSMGYVGVDQPFESPQRSFIKLWPNPTSEVLKLSSKARLSRVLIRDVHGTLVQEAKLYGTDNELQVSGLPAGVYLIEAYAENGKRGVQRFVKLRDQ